MLPEAEGGEEAALAIQEGEVDVDGISVIAVCNRCCLKQKEEKRNFCVGELCLASSAVVASLTAGALEEETYTNTTQDNCWEESDMAF
ncbi:hypothetical protein PR048_029876 [Dryococelus australis]|uniref:Uncharacterized protein n=1 Tax=Dryococelus australis TaxID=614101 RepID=A0ABQ9G7D4_9NEOP|nr:hypothetical protein PR048_029876 [Dryococelus australis]